MHPEPDVCAVLRTMLIHFVRSFIGCCCSCNRCHLIRDYFVRSNWNWNNSIVGRSFAVNAATSRSLFQIHFIKFVWTTVMLINGFCWLEYAFLPVESNQRLTRLISNAGAATKTCVVMTVMNQQAQHLFRYCCDHRWVEETFCEVKCVQHFGRKSLNSEWFDVLRWGYSWTPFIRNRWVSHRNEENYVITTLFCSINRTS